MSYSRNFGMRSFENIVRDGRFRTPVGSTLTIGEPVAIDPNNAGFLMQAAAGDAPDAGNGVLIFEHIQRIGVDPVLATSSDQIFDKVPGGRYAQMVHGPGAKVWFKNTASRSLYSGAGVAAAGLLAASVNVANVKPGAGLTPDGAGKYKVASGADGVWLLIEQVNPSTGLVEARFTF